LREATLDLDLLEPITNDSDLTTTTTQSTTTTTPSSTTTTTTAITTSTKKTNFYSESKLMNALLARELAQRITRDQTQCQSSSTSTQVQYLNNESLLSIMS
jgi:hypothetical protein